MVSELTLPAVAAKYALVQIEPLIFNSGKCLYLGIHIK